MAGVDLSVRKYQFSCHLFLGDLIKVQILKDIEDNPYSQWCKANFLTIQCSNTVIKKVVKGVVSVYIEGVVAEIQHKPILEIPGICVVE